MLLLLLRASRRILDGRGITGEDGLVRPDAWSEAVAEGEDDEDYGEVPVGEYLVAGGVWRRACPPDLRDAEAPMGALDAPMGSDLAAEVEAAERAAQEQKERDAAELRRRLEMQVRGGGLRKNIYKLTKISCFCRRIPRRRARRPRRRTPR